MILDRRLSGLSRAGTARGPSCAPGGSPELPCQERLRLPDDHFPERRSRATIEKVKPFVVFVCTGNCIRSQMAEGLLRKLAPGRFDIASAGVAPAGYVHDLAIEVMGEVGVDLTGHESKGLAEALSGCGGRAPRIVVLCSFAAEQLAALEPREPLLQWILADPISARGTVSQRLEVFRRARDTIAGRLLIALERGELD